MSFPLFLFLSPKNNLFKHYFLTKKKKKEEVETVPSNRASTLSNAGEKIIKFIPITVCIKTMLCFNVQKLNMRSITPKN